MYLLHFNPRKVIPVFLPGSPTTLLNARNSSLLAWMDLFSSPCHRTFPLNIKKLCFAVGQVAWGSGRVSFLRHIVKLRGHGPGQSALGGPA